MSSGNDLYTVSLLDMEGSDASTVFTDTASGGVHAWTASGSAQIDTATYRIGAAAGLFGLGSADFIWAADSDDWNFGTGDFTIDLWVNFRTLPASGAYYMFCSQMTDVNHVLYVGIKNNSGTYQLDFYTTVGTGTSIIRCLKNLTSLATYTWYHFAIVRSGSNFTWYAGGAPTGATAGTVTGASACADLSATFEYGRWNYTSPYYLKAWIDGARVSKGIARWTATFTPTGPYGADRTKSLSDSVTLGESTIRKPKLIKSDILTLTEGIVKKSGLIKTDILSLGETLSNSPHLAKADSISLGEAIVKRPKPVKSDSITILESISKKPGIVKTDSIPLSDALVKFLHVKKSDIISLVDSVSKRFNLNRSDVITILDFFSYVLHVVAIFLNLSDGIYLSDVIKKSPHLFKSDALTILDQNIKQYRLKKQDYIFLSDLFLRSARPAASALFRFVHKKRTEQKFEQGGDFEFIHTKRLMPEGKTGGDFRFVHKKRRKE